MAAYLRGVRSRGVVRRVPEVPGGPDDAAGLRAANARLRELLAERDARIAEQRAEISVTRRSRAAGWPRLPTLDRRPQAGAGWLLAADRWA